MKKYTSYLDKMYDDIREIDRINQILYDEEARRELREAKEIARKIREEEENYD